MNVNPNDVEKEMSKRTMKQYCSSWKELTYDEIRNRPYFIGKKNDNSDAEVFCPINSNKVLTYDELRATIVDSGSSSVKLAIYGSDSSVVLYKAQMGLKPPIIVPVNEKSSEVGNPELTVDLSEPSKKRKLDSTTMDDFVAPNSGQDMPAPDEEDYLEVVSQPSEDLEVCLADENI